MTRVSRIKNTLKKSTFLITCYENIDTQFRAFLYALSPELLAKYRFFMLRHRLPKLSNPQTFDEKLLWLNFYWRHPLKAKCADKFEMRSYVTDYGFSHILPHMLGIYDRYDQIDLVKLPKRFVLKCTHGCGYNIICKSKADLDWKEARRRLALWLQKDLSKLAGEIHYAKIKPRIISEVFLDDSSGDVPADYKVYCFNGKAHCTMACTERGTSERAKFYFYDRQWDNLLPYNATSLVSNRDIPKPEAYEEMIHAAECLSMPFPFVRMDFYIIKGKVILGEMTFTPNGCIDTGYTDCAQHELGQLIKLPEKLLG